MLTEVEEEQLASYLKYMALTGCPVNKVMLRIFATDIARKSYRSTQWDDKEATDGWVRGFLKRHPDLKSSKLVTMEDARAKLSKDQVGPEHIFVPFNDRFLLLQRVSIWV